MLKIEQYHSEHSTDKEQGIEPAMEELKFHLSTQGICYNSSAGTDSQSNEYRIALREQHSILASGDDVIWVLQFFRAPGKA